MCMDTMVLSHESWNLSFASVKVYIYKELKTLNVWFSPSNCPIDFLFTGMIYGIIRIPYTIFQSNLLNL